MRPFAPFRRLTARAWDYLFGNSPVARRPRPLGLEALEGRDVPTNVSIAALGDAVEGGAAGTFRVYRDGDLSDELVVNLNIGGGAGNGLDNNWIDNTITITANAGHADIIVTAFDDGEYDPGEVLTIEVITGINYDVDANNNAADVELIDNTPVVTVARIADATEGGAGGFLFTRTGSVSEELTVSYTAGGTAAPDVDYPGLYGEVTFDAGSATAELWFRALQDGDATEPTETVIVALADGAGYVVGGADQAAADLLDDERPVVSVERVSDAAEGGAAGVVRFTRTGDTSQPLTVYYAHTGSPLGNPAEDFEFAYLPGSIVIPEGEASATVDLIPWEDDLVEGPAAVTVCVMPVPDYAVWQDSRQQADVVVYDNDVGIVIQPSGLKTEVDEDDRDTYIVSLSVQPSSAVTVHITAGSPLLLASALQPTPASSLTLTFTPADWDVPQLVTVSAPDNGVVDGERQVQVVHSAASTDIRYDGIASAFLVRTQDKANPDPRQTAAHWKTVADKRIEVPPPPAGGQRLELHAARLRNIRINAAYAELAAAHQKTFYWMGLAPFASEQAGLAIESAADIVYKGIGTAPVRAGLLANARALAAGNLDVYNDLYWQHLAYAHGGVALMRTFKQQGHITQAHLDAWEKIAEGVADNNADKKWEGNLMLLRHEQETVLQPHFNALIGEEALGLLIKSPVPDGESFAAYMLRVRAPGKVGPKNFADRWRWIDKAVVPDWQRFLTNKPNDVTEFYKKMTQHEAKHKFNP